MEVRPAPGAIDLHNDDDDTAELDDVTTTDNRPDNHVDNGPDDVEHDVNQHDDNLELHDHQHHQHHSA